MVFGELGKENAFSASGSIKFHFTPKQSAPQQQQQAGKDSLGPSAQRPPRSTRKAPTTAAGSLAATTPLAGLRMSLRDLDVEETFAELMQRKSPAPATSGMWRS